MMYDRIKALENKIEDLKLRWPAHSVPPSMLQELEDLEEELESAINQDERGKGAHQNSSN